MLRIRYSPLCGVDLEGTRDELRAIRAAILAVSSGESPRRAFDAVAQGSPEPYDAWLGRLVVCRGAGPTRVAVHDSELQVDGDPECLQALASFLDVPLEAQAELHSHHEHYEGNRWVTPDSEPLVVSLQPT